MTRILDQLPVVEERSTMRFDGKQVVLHANQILVWVSLHLADVLQPEKNIPRIPALLDTGNNVGFTIQHRQLREWAGIDPVLLPLLGTININAQKANLHGATVWLHRNMPGRREVAEGKLPHLLQMKQ